MVALLMVYFNIFHGLPFCLKVPYEMIFDQVYDIFKKFIFQRTNTDTEPM